MGDTLDYNRTVCQEEIYDQPGFYSLNRQFIQECSEFVENIVNLKDSPWKSKDIVQWIRGDLKQRIGKTEVQLLKFLQQEYFLKNSPCFCKQPYIAKRLETSRISINSAIQSLDKKGFIIKISWLYKGRRKNTILLPQIPSLVNLIDQKNQDNKEYRKIYSKFRKLFVSNNVGINKKKEQEGQPNLRRLKTINKLLNSQQQKNALLRYSNILYINILFNNNHVTINNIIIDRYSRINICKQIATLGKTSKVALRSDNQNCFENHQPYNHKVDTNIDSKNALVINKELEPNQPSLCLGFGPASDYKKALVDSKGLDSNKAKNKFDYRFCLKSILINDESLVTNKKLDPNQEIITLDSIKQSIDNSVKEALDRLLISGTTFESQKDFLNKLSAEIKRDDEPEEEFLESLYNSEIKSVKKYSSKKRNRTEDYRPLTDKELNAWMDQLNAESTTQLSRRQKFELFKLEKEEERKLIEERNQKIVKKESVNVAVVEYKPIPESENRFKTILNQQHTLIDEILADNLLNEVKSSIMVDKYLLKRKIKNKLRGEKLVEEEYIKNLVKNDFDFDKIPVFDQNRLNDHISCFHGIDMKPFFKIPYEPERRKSPYLKHPINIRRCLLRVIATGNEIEWDYADKVIEYWNKLPIQSGWLRKMRIGSKDSKSYIYAAIVISDCLIHGANRNLNVMFKAMDRLVIADERRKAPFTWQYKPSIDHFFMIHDKNKVIKTYLGSDIDFEKFLYARKHKQKNLQRLKVGYEKFTEMYISQFYINNEEKGKEVCYRYENMIKNWLEEKIEDIKNTCHKSGKIKRKLYNYSLITDRKDQYGDIPPLLQRFFYFINREYHGSITFVDMFKDKTWNEFIEKHMRIEVGLTDFWEPIPFKKNGNGNGRKKTNNVTTRSGRHTRVPATA